MTKKPAQLSDSLLAHRPRKGEAKAQSEAEAKSLAPQLSSKLHPTHALPGRRRGARSPNTIQINIKVRPEIADRFTALADRENLIFGDMLARLVENFEEKNQ